MADIVGSVPSSTFIANTALTGQPKVAYTPTANIVSALRFGGAAVAAATILYRGRLGGNYVYQTGSPPGGAVDVVIIAIY